MDKTPLVSVIVPVYKVEDYLARCVDSLLSQTYENLEIVLVDDGSPDNCGAICDSYAGKDSRVVVLHKPNGGLSDARNEGMKISKGEYFVFVDSDDWVSPYYISNLVSALGTSDLAISWFENVFDGEDPKTVASDTLQKLEILDSKTCFERLLYMDGVDTTACGKLYSKSLFGDLQFPMGKLYEDIIFAMHVIERCSSVSLVKNVDYYYFQRKGSIQYQKFNPRKMDLMVHMEMLGDLVLSLYPDLRKAVACRQLSAACNMVFQIQDTKANEVEFNQLWSSVKQNRFTVLFDGKARKKARIAALLSCLGYRFMKKVYSMTQMRG